MNTATLLIVEGAEQGTRFDVTTDSVQIGRGAHNPIRILDTEVSRSHAVLKHEDDQWTLTDIGSANGTYLNGEKITSSPVNHGDQIQFGRSLVLFRIDRDSFNPAELSGRVRLTSPSSTISKAQAEIISELYQPKLEASPQDSKLESAPEKVLANLKMLYKISEEVVRPSYSMDELLERILTLTLGFLKADRGCILLNDPTSGELVPRALVYREGLNVNADMPISRSIIDYVMTKKAGVRTSDARHDSRFEAGQSILRAGIQEALCVPMVGRGNIFGVIYVDTTIHSPDTNADPEEHFGEEQLRLMFSIATQAALSIESSRYQESLIQAERLAAVGQTITMLSHHIKNILQGIRGGSFLIDRGLGQSDTELIRQGWSIVERNQGKIYNLVMDMLSFSKDRQPSLEKADLNEVILEVSELARSRGEELGVEIETLLDESIPPSVFDTEGIHRAILNIVMNGIDAGEEVDDGKVTIASSHDRELNRLVVRVRDNGPGIEPAQLDRIFNLFESSKGGRGTGLGLAVSRKIIREHDGTVTVESEVGQGTLFELSWPYIRPESDDASKRTISQ